MEVGAYTHRGRVRKTNEDYYYIPRGEKDVQNLLIVADGVGGHNAGDVASFIGVNTVLDIIAKRKIVQKESVDLEELVYHVISEANLQIYKLAQKDVKFHGMGTTMTMAIIDGDDIVIGHVGDSRAYILKGKDLTQITRDHSLVEELIKNGSITEDEALHHPQKNIITRSLGLEKYVDIDVFHLKVKPEDKILLCSDGLTNHISSDELGVFLSMPYTCQQLAENLVNMAVDRGGNDNITVIVYQNTKG